MDDGESSAVAFRSVKRRKIGRKAYEIDRAPEESVQLAVNDAMPVTGQRQKLDKGGVVSIAKKTTGSKKLGIGFSSTDRASVKPETTEEQILASSAGEAMREAPQIDRFVKPTGRVILEDKHMYVFTGSCAA